MNGASANSSVKFSNVECIFKHESGRTVRALDNVSFEVPAGEFVAIVGRSGHGKSTLLRVLAGLQAPTGGQVTVGTNLVEGPGPERSMVFQQDAVFPWMSVRDNVEFGLRARGEAKEDRAKTSARWLEAVDLTNFAGSWPRELSGGMRKRVALAAVLAMDSDVWLMDEPFGSLDYFTRRSLHDLLLELWGETQKTIFFVTHDIEEALILADRILLVRDGRIVEDMDNDLPRPRDEEIRASRRSVDLTKTIVDHLASAGESADADETGERA